MKQANQSFWYLNGDGQDVFVPAGKVLPDNHPDVQGHESLFDDLGSDQPAPAKASRKAS
jgi:hypothetical protein